MAMNNNAGTRFVDARRHSLLGCVSACLLLVSCTSTEQNKNLYDPLRNAETREVSSIPTGEAETSADTSTKEAPVPTPIQRQQTSGTAPSAIAAGLKGEDIAVNFRNMPLPEFIHEIYGRLLGFNFVLDPTLTGAADLVTLSLSAPVAPVDLFRIARSVLAEYGVGIVDSDDILRFRRDNDAAQEVPLLVSGAALPDVPPTRRPVFSFVVLEVVSNAQVRGWLQQIFKGTPLTIQEDPVRNAIVLNGPLELVTQASETTQLLDQPLLKGKSSRSFTPTYLSANELANDLEKVLAAEGYAVSQRPPLGSIILLPLKSQERVIIFAASQDTLNHALAWAYNLDAEEKDKMISGFFSYKAQNVTAEHIANLIGLLKGGSEQEPSQSAGSRQMNSGVGSSSSGEGTSSSGGTGAQSFLGGKLVVDDNRNVLFFSGSGQEWREMLQLIEEVDKPVPMVVIDVLLAEITLSGQEESGVEWLFTGGGPVGTDLSGSTRGGLGVGSSGLSLTFDSAGQTRSIINAFYSNDRAVIRSSPKLLVKSGEEAFIEVGNEIPIITSNSQSTESGSAPIVQTIQYRKTGVLLTINPIVQASGMVDLRISQELSEQTTGSGTSVSGSPTILNRKVETSLALRDGGSVLLGGLISSSRSEGEQGIPILGKLPLFGRLFRTDIQTDAQTELLMLVSVYVIDGHDDAVELTNTLKERLNAPTN